MFKQILQDFFVDVAMYDWPEALGFHLAPVITRIKFQRIYLVKEGTLGVKDVLFTNLYVYPNPTNGILYISSKENIISVQVTNMLGQTVINYSKDNFSIKEINLSRLSTGIYIIRIFDGIKVETRKIIKK